MGNIRQTITYTIELFAIAEEYQKQVTCKEEIPQDLIYDMFASSVMSHEEIHAIYLDNSKIIRFTEKLTMGSVNASLMNFDKIMTTMATQRTPGVILIHNHPSGHKQFSSSDKMLMKRLDQIMVNCHFQLVDFLLVDPDFNLYSLKHG